MLPASSFAGSVATPLSPTGPEPPAGIWPRRAAVWLTTATSRPIAAPRRMEQHGLHVTAQSSTGPQAPHTASEWPITAREHQAWERISLTTLRRVTAPKKTQRRYQLVWPAGQTKAMWQSESMSAVHKTNARFCRSDRRSEIRAYSHMPKKLVGWGIRAPPPTLSLTSLSPLAQRRKSGHSFRHLEAA